MKLPNIYKSLKLTLSFVIIATALSCKSTKNVIASGEASDKLSAKQVIKQHEKNEADFKTMNARVEIDLIQGEKEQGHTFSFRMEKDKVIWLSASFGMARMMITPDKVQFYNKIDNEYFDGDYKLLSDVAGIDLDFNRVQNILLGQAITNLKDEPYQVAINENSYALQPKDQNALLELFYLINPSHFKMDSLQMFQQLKKRMLQVDYASYQEVDKQILPKNIRIIAVEDSDQVAITLEYKSVSLNEEVRFPFKIPAGYKEIVIK
ncbi:MAG: deoxyuridine 5'-triphosphate nucleotidohydrolase [Hyphomonadaceae bacterium]|nr:deoxyuridine 5'-triphosphate nucleotidohydrolase [Hyphomonadaceae bacterium]